jgi:sugar fermentation stimulation protein A
MLREQGVLYRALTFRLPDPVSVDMDSVREIPIRMDLVRSLKTGHGTYLLVMRREGPQSVRVRVGALGEIELNPGYYVYVGSGMGALEPRIRRHMSTRKKQYWHIDYVTPQHLKPVRYYLIRRNDRIESALADRLRSIASHRIAGFGASDSPADSHLFHFSEPPYQNRAFIDTILDFRTMTEKVKGTG